MHSKLAERSRTTLPARRLSTRRAKLWESSPLPPKTVCGRLVCSTRLPLMRFDAGEQNLVPTNRTCWYRSPSNLRLEGSSKSQTPNPKESSNPDTQIHQESVGVCIVGDSLRLGFGTWASRRDAVSV